MRKEVAAPKAMDLDLPPGYSLSKYLATWVTKDGQPAKCIVAKWGTPTGPCKSVGFGPPSDGDEGLLRHMATLLLAHKGEIKGVPTMPFLPKQ
jgi:hypothetical protein